MTQRRLAPLVALTVAALLGTAACSAIGDTGPDGGSGAGSTGGAGTVVLVTHDSFAVDRQLVADFERESGLTVETTSPGDAGTLVNQLVLSKQTPLGDAVFGIDTAFASRALTAGILQPYASPRTPPAADRFAVDDSHRLTAVDYGDVCINIDREWFRRNGLPEPRTFADLADPTYEGLTVVTNPATSSPGLSFLLATVDAFGADGWLDYWADLRANDVQVSDSWSDAYFVEFSGSQGNGPRPIVVSYASSPPAEVAGAGDEPTTSALLSTCFRQVEYAGVLAGADNPEGARQLIDFMLSTRFQQTIPSRMYMYPVDEQADLPPTWARFGPLSRQPHHISPGLIEANREVWIRRWTEVVVG